MTRERRACFACGAEVPDVDGPTHRYMLSSPGCWSIYGEVLAREYSSSLYAAKHRLTVDAYAVQHPGRPSRQTIRSVCLHLCTLSLVLERGVPPFETSGLIQRLAARDDYRWLEPPASVGDRDVVYVHSASGPQQHLLRVEEWATSAWLAWEAHHETVRRWVEACL